MVSNFLRIYTLESLLWPFLVVAVLGGLLVVVRRWRGGSRPVRVTLYTILLLGMMEFGVCRSVYFVALAARVLTVEDIGFRQRGIVLMELGLRQKDDVAKYLAVGTSQTGAIYGPYSRKHEDVNIFSLAGLRLTELPLYDDIIADRCSETVLLYVSEFDLNYEPSEVAMRLAPPQDPGTLWRSSKRLYRTGAASIWGIADMWMANAMTAYRLQFVLKGFVKRITGESRAFAAEQVSGEAGAGDFLQAQVDGIEQMKDEWFQANVDALEEFLAWCAKKGLRVVVVQGQYHPEMEAKHLALRAKARSLVELVCAKHRNARFLGTERTSVFAVEDYRDATHVTPEAGTKFVERLLADLEKQDTAGLPPLSSEQVNAGVGFAADTASVP